MGSRITELRNITKSYPLVTPPNGREVPAAVEKVDLTIQEGEFLAIIRPSGCGKSTLLNMIGLWGSLRKVKFMRRENESPAPHPKITIQYGTGRATVFPVKHLEHVQHAKESD